MRRRKEDRRAPGSCTAAGKQRASAACVVPGDQDRDFRMEEEGMRGATKPADAWHVN
jgi:hypothetical protein